ncbi:zinc finger protein 830-like [Littorina saxatilis]|uniref:Zinc finger protein 830 n=1 Tax=Littorina saxatilis TaxID=31220 RepID=A0AAN9GDX8_9CAEN
MASKKAKKVVSQDQLRRLMRQKQFSVKTVTSKIEHPLAKYNGLEQLVCTLCNTVIKNNNLWVPHIQSSKHKEKYLASKTQGPAKPAEVVGSKRKLTDAEILAAKKAKVLTSDSNGLNTSNSSTANKVSALAGYSSSSSSEGEDEEEEKTSSNKTSLQLPSSSNDSNKTGPNGLPADFFDASFKPEGETAESSAKPSAMADVLPEGFFDDPKMDAKVRKVEYKDKMEEEWKLFQRSMKEEAHVSEVILEEDEEEANAERNLDEIDDQIQRWQEVEDLHIKKDTIAKTTGDDDDKDKDSDDLGDEDLDQFLDWRAKKSWK